MAGYCAACGAEVLPDALYCHKCGHRLEQASESGEKSTERQVDAQLG